MTQARVWITWSELLYEIRIARVMLASCQLQIWTVLLGARSWRWVRLEADTRWRIPSGHSSPAVHITHRHRLSHLACIILHDRICHCRRALHRVSSLCIHLCIVQSLLSPRGDIADRQDFTLLSLLCSKVTTLDFLHVLPCFTSCVVTSA